MATRSPLPGQEPHRYRYPIRPAQAGYPGIPIRNEADAGPQDSPWHGRRSHRSQPAEQSPGQPASLYSATERSQPERKWEGDKQVQGCAPYQE